MNNGIIAEEACRKHALTQEDFAQMCNADGSLKKRSETTTFSIGGDESTSITIDNSALNVSLLAMGLIALVVVVLIFARILKKSRLR